MINQVGIVFFYMTNQVLLYQVGEDYLNVLAGVSDGGTKKKIENDRTLIAV